jgi:uncharacterized membrane protein
VDLLPSLIGLTVFAGVALAFPAWFAVALFKRGTSQPMSVFISALVSLLVQLGLAWIWYFLSMHFLGRFP